MKGRSGLSLWTARKERWLVSGLGLNAQYSYPEKGFIINAVVAFFCHLAIGPWRLGPLFALRGPKMCEQCVKMCICVKKHISHTFLSISLNIQMCFLTQNVLKMCFSHTFSDPLGFAISLFTSTRDKTEAFPGQPPCIVALR